MSLPSLGLVAGTLVGHQVLRSVTGLFSRLLGIAKAGGTISSLADLSQPARVEPLVVVDQSIADQPYMTDVMKSCLSIFTGYYLQGLALLMRSETGAEAGRVDVIKVLEALNPNRGVNYRDKVWSQETYADGFPSMEAFKEAIPARQVVSIENERGSASIDSDSAKKLHEVENLTVGKMVSMEVREGDTVSRIPILVRLAALKATASVIAHIVEGSTKTASFLERIHMWRAGQIRFVRDLMFSIDIIDQHRRLLVNDTSNVYQTISDRRRRNVLASGLSKNPSLADASNILVVSAETAREMERRLGGKLDNLNTRKKLFNGVYLLLLVVVDERWERVTMYHRGLDAYTEASFREIKSSERGKGPDITEILKAYTLGSTPSI